MPRLCVILENMEKFSTFRHEKFQNSQPLRMISHQGSLYQNITVSLGGRAKLKKSESRDRGEKWSRDREKRSRDVLEGIRYLKLRT